MKEIFKRSATGWKEFADAPKHHIEYVDTASEAVTICTAFNDSRTPQQIAKGTKYEFREA